MAPRIALGASLGAMLLFAAPAAGATKNLNACSFFGGWSQSSCWTPSGAPTTGDDVVIDNNTANPGPAQSKTTYDLGPAVLLRSITLNSANNNVTVAGGPIGLQSGGFITDNWCNLGTNVLPGVTLNGSTTFTRGSCSSSPSTLSFDGAVTGTGPVTLVNNGAQDALRLNAVNTYSGSTTIDGTARVTASVNGSIPTASALTVTATGSIDFQNESTIGSLAGGGLVNVNAPSLTAGGDNTNTTFSGILQGGPGAAFTKAGTGTLTLSGNATNTGTTTINAGTLALTGTMVAPVSVNSGGTLAGTGSTTSTATVNSGGTLAPGLSVGTLSTRGLILGSGSTFAAEIDGGGSDRMEVGPGAPGSVDLGGATLNLSFLGGYVHTPGTVYTLVANDDVDPITGTFSGLPEGATLTAGGNRFRISDVGGTGNDATLRAIATPTVSTNASAGVTLGGQVRDTATLAGGSSPGGSITFRLDGPNDASCCGYTRVH